MSKDDEWHDYHHEYKRMQENQRVIDERRQNRIDRLRGNSIQASRDEVAPSTIPDQKVDFGFWTLIQMASKVHDEISECDGLSPVFKISWSRELKRIDLTLPDAYDKLTALAQEVGDTGEQRRSIQEKLWELATKVEEYQNRRD